MMNESFPRARWVPVVDATGHRRMEMRWSVTAQVGARAA